MEIDNSKGKECNPASEGFRKIITKGWPFLRSDPISAFGCSTVGRNRGKLKRQVLGNLLASLLICCI